MTISDKADEVAIDPEAAEKNADSTSSASLLSKLLKRWKGIAVAGVVLVASVLTTMLYINDFRPTMQTDAAAEQVVVDEASSATVALLSYSPDTLDRDMERAQSLMTGEFLTYYGKFTSDVVAPAVRDKGIKASAQVMNSAVMEMQPNNAKVLVFLNQETVSRDRPEPSLVASSVVVSVSKVDGKWLISALDPV